MILFPPDLMEELKYREAVEIKLFLKQIDGRWQNDLREGAAINAQRIPNFATRDTMDMPDQVAALATRCRLDEGDTLFIPMSWHHDVLTEQPKGGGFSAAINYWYKYK